jgi:hypothetical protein
MYKSIPGQALPPFPSAFIENFLGRALFAVGQGTFIILWNRMDG